MIWRNSPYTQALCNITFVINLKQSKTNYDKFLAFYSFERVHRDDQK